MMFPSLLPPGSTRLEKALEQVAAGLLDIPTPVRAVWSPKDCPIELLPWLASYCEQHYRPEPRKKPKYATNKDKGRMGNWRPDK